MKRQSKSFEIALSAIACAAATLFLTLGTLTPFLLVTGYLVGTFALMVPLAKDFVWGNVLAFVAASLLSLLLGGIAYFWRLLPFIMFFGLHPLVNYVQRRFLAPRFKWHFAVCLPVKAVWFDGTAYLFWRFALAMSAPIEWINQNILLVVLVGGTIFFVAYDYMIFLCQKSVDNAVRRIRK